MRPDAPRDGGGNVEQVAPEVIRPCAICRAIFGRHLSRGVGKATSCLHASFNGETRPDRID